ncbi:50S ribosomal protein L30 [Candidatus Woesearchaeota archaeon]|jgi:large subunit ribosomal protein L30|nr:50S ribosomal protein L30 [Candidatus Woesearchaeota archaeon]|tara:strand:- start:2689 stop:3216 length:528 start_codon:yes stop_codon:yes gene_type:complete
MDNDNKSAEIKAEGKAEAKQPEEKAAPPKDDPNKKIAVIRIRGLVNIRKTINNSLEILRLYRRNYCVVLPNTPNIIGMVKKAKDYITWGELNDETYKLLVEKRGEEYKGREADNKKKINYKNRYFVYNNKKYKKCFRLSPPRGGFERKGTKKAFSQGGALGYRAEKINLLIKKML